MNGARCQVHRHETERRTVYHHLRLGRESGGQPAEPGLDGSGERTLEVIVYRDLKDHFALTRATAK